MENMIGDMANSLYCCEIQRHMAEFSSSFFEETIHGRAGGPKLDLSRLPVSRWSIRHKSPSPSELKLARATSDCSNTFAEILKSEA